MRSVERAFARRLTWAAALFLAVVLPGVATHAAEPQENVCEAQLIADVTARFGAQIDHIRYTWADESSDRFETSESLTSAVVYPTHCDGYYWYQLAADEFTCRFQAHYGTVPNYVIFRSVNGGCK